MQWWTNVSSSLPAIGLRCISPTTFFDVEAASVLNSGHLWSPKGRQTLIEMCSRWWATWFIITHNFPLKGLGCGADGGGCLHGGWLSPKRTLWRLAFIYNIRHGKNWLMRNENPGFLVAFNLAFRLVSNTTEECYVSRLLSHLRCFFPKTREYFTFGF